MAESWAVAPTVTEALDGEVVIDATEAGDAAMTVAVAVALLPWLEAVRIALPTAIAVTMPLEDTVAVLVFEEVQVMAADVTTLPFASSATAVNGLVPPGLSDTDVGDTRTVATGAGPWAMTVTLAWAVRLSDVAAIEAVPAARSVTTPMLETLAACELFEVQVIDWLAMTRPCWSYTVAASVSTCPTVPLRLDGVIEMRAARALLSELDPPPAGSVRAFPCVQLPSSNANTHSRSVPRMCPPLASQFGGSTGVVCGPSRRSHGSLVALRPRLSPGLPLSQTPRRATYGEQFCVGAYCSAVLDATCQDTKSGYAQLPMAYLVT